MSAGYRIARIVGLVAMASTATVGVDVGESAGATFVSAPGDTEDCGQAIYCVVGGTNPWVPYGPNPLVPWGVNSQSSGPGLAGTGYGLAF